MKRIIGVILIISMLLSVLSTGIAVSANNDWFAMAYTSIKFSDYEVDPGDEVEMTVSIIPNTDIEVLGIELNIEYNYQRDFSYPFTLVAEKTQLSEEFETASVAQRYADTPIVFVWDSIENLEFKANEEIVLGTFTLKVSEKALIGDYMFSVFCNEFYYSYEYEDENGVIQRELVDVNVDAGESIEVFIGERLDVGGSFFNIPVCGSKDFIFEIYANKLLDHEETYIENTDIAEIVEIVDEEDYSRIRVRGKMLGESTSLYIRSADESFDEDIIVAIRIVEPKIAILTKKSLPKKTVYYVGEKCDKQTLLEGLSVKVDYENYDEKTFDNLNDFTLGEYDFSTPGEKTVKVYFDDAYTFLKYTVKATPEYIGSTVYSANAAEIFGVPENTSVEDFINNTNVSDRIKIYDANGNPVTEGIITTGMKAEFVLDDVVKASATISVKYDVNCDGKVGIKDLMLCKKAALGEKTLSSAQLKSIGGTANAQTLVQIKNYILQ